MLFFNKKCKTCRYDHFLSITTRYHSCCLNTLSHDDFSPKSSFFCEGKIDERFKSAWPVYGHPVCSQCISRNGLCTKLPDWKSPHWNREQWSACKRWTEQRSLSTSLNTSRPQVCFFYCGLEQFCGLHLIQPDNSRLTFFVNSAAWSVYSLI